MRPFYILSIDGGGFRGSFAAHVLRRIERERQVSWHATFGMFAGTSTGSILAAGLAKGLRAETLAKFYSTYGGEIFTPRTVSRLDQKKLFMSRYDSRTLRSVLEQEFGNTTLGQITVPLILPSVDIGNGCVHVFKSPYGNFVRDVNVRLSDAVLASCSAPTYFDPHSVNSYQLADGGLWANNPSLVAVIDAHHRLKIPLSDIRVLSIGTGKSKTFYPGSENSRKGWGLVTGWKGGKLIDLILNLQSDAAHNILCLLLGESPLEPRKVCRLTFESDLPLPMDATNKLRDWIAQADRVFSHNTDRICEFLSQMGVTQ